MNQNFLEKLSASTLLNLSDFFNIINKCKLDQLLKFKDNNFKKTKEILTKIKSVDSVKYSRFLTDKILLQPKFLHLTKLNIENNPKITNLNRFKKLSEINISVSRCGVDDAGICELENLLIINAYSNPKITNLNRFKKLTEIYINGNCGVGDAGICELENLLIIDAFDNTKITNLNRFKKLTEINISGFDCEVNGAGICELENLLIINSYSNPKITNLNRFKKLTEINIGWTCEVGDAGICELENLLIIKANDNPKITNLNRFKKLTEIDISFNCGVDDAGICELENLLIINACVNPKITNLNRFKKLTEIDIAGSCGVDDAGISEFENLLIIKACGNPKITNLNRFKKLTEIDISYCGVDDAGICELSSSTNSRGAVENLLKINASNNPKITNAENLIRKVKNDAKSINFKIDLTDTTIFDLACSIYKKKNNPNLNEILNEIKVGIFEGLENNKTFYQYINGDLDQKSIDRLKNILDNNNIKTEDGLKINFKQFL
jgi:hypothetical protein